MSVIKIEPILPKRNLFDQVRYRTVIENAGNMTAKAIQVDYEVTVETWTHKATFRIKHSPGSGSWIISTSDKIYGYVSGGTRPHIIRPKARGRLRFFRTGFRPKSRVGWIGSNKGHAANKDLAFAKEVHHPGTEARKYPEVIKKKWEAEWGRQLARAIRSAQAHGGK